MQSSAPNDLECCQEGYFQCMDKEIAIETVNFIPAKVFTNDMVNYQRKKKEVVAWKLNQLKKPIAYSKRSTHIFSKNISFEDEEKYSSSDDEKEDSTELADPEESSFACYYKDQEEIYRKKYAFGTNWIGRKQYYASTFINPANIEKGSLQYYYNQQNDQPSNGKISFDSNFESGNLLSVYRINEHEYDLLLQNDLNSKGNTQWFYFRLSNPPRNVNIKLNIVNMRKSDSLFNYGMMPCIRSIQEERRTKKGWFRGGKLIKYFKNEHQVENSKRFYYTLTFTISTPYENDVIRIAQAYPYTFTDLNTYLGNLELIKYKKDFIERETLMNTIGKNRVEAITIKQANNRVKNRPFIIIIARQHPGESPGSFVCQGLMDYLLGKEKESQFLRKNYEIRIIPMANPDGVCAGNYRTNLYGYDLNRRWDGTKLKNVHEAATIKKYIGCITKGREVSFILDLHGHSRKMYSFFYGNSNPSNPADVRVFPLICAKVSPYCIKFEDCTFATEDDKRNTARVQFSLLFKCSNILTFQSSFFGYFGKDKDRRHFTIEDYKQLGAAVGKAMYLHEKGKELYDTNPEHKEVAVYKRCMYELRNDLVLISLGDKANSGSQSNPEECQLKESQGQRLQDNEQYSKENRIASKNIKNIKKIGKKELLKLPSRSQRQMQVMDIAQVNSMYPNNLLALIPASFLAKKRKVQTSSKLVQTENTPLVKIYQTCKQQQNKLFYNPQTFIIHPRSQIGSPQMRNTSNLLKSNILTRSRSEIEDRQMLSSVGLGKIVQRKEKQAKSMTEKSSHKKSQSCTSGKGYLSKETQTILSFNCMNFGQIKSKLEKEASILEFKTIDPSFTSFNYHRQKQGNIIGKTSSINILQSIKIKKRHRL